MARLLVVFLTTAGPTQVVVAQQGPDEAAAPGVPAATSAVAASTAAPSAMAVSAATGLDAWRDHLRPCEAERAWERIGWHASFADGLRAANAERRPLLLWIMNGHPL